ncbi:MAG: response regulator [Deltaproteobacteria bacterium]|nr:response regulator [Deltaproteobacteria bacterium]
MNATVLYVDDDRMQLERFEQKLGKFFKVIPADSGPKGVEVLEKNAIHVVVADQEMQGMNGIEFLKEAQRISPHVPRIMLTAQEGEALVIQAVNEGKVQGYVRKPLDGKESEVLSLLNLCYQNYLKEEVIQRQNKELRDLVDQVKLSKEKDVAIARLESRHRVVNELGHNLRNPMTPVYTCYQMLGEMATQYQSGKLSDAEKREMFEQAIKMIGIAAPEMERLREELKNLSRFIQDETDPVGDAGLPLKKR